MVRRFNSVRNDWSERHALRGVARIIQRVDNLLNAGEKGAVPCPTNHLVAHSTRIGATYDLAANGMDLRSIMHSSG